MMIVNLLILGTAQLLYTADDIDLHTGIGSLKVHTRKQSCLAHLIADTTASSRQSRTSGPKLVSWCDDTSGVVRAG